MAGVWKPGRRLSKAHSSWSIWERSVTLSALLLWVWSCPLIVQYSLRIGYYEWRGGEERKDLWCGGTNIPFWPWLSRWWLPFYHWREELRKHLTLCQSFSMCSIRSRSCCFPVWSVWIWLAILTSVTPTCLCTEFGSITWIYVCRVSRYSPTGMWELVKNWHLITRWQVLPPRLPFDCHVMLIPCSKNVNNRVYLNRGH